MSYFRMFEMLAADVPTPPTGKFSFFFDTTSGEPSYKDDTGLVTSLAGVPGPGVPTGGTAGQVLSKIDGTDYNTQWATVSVSPGGSDKYVQFNDGGALGGESDFQYDKTTNVLAVGNINIAATGLVATAASTSANAGLRIPHGAAPSSPANGDFWTTTAGVYARVNGVTVGPLSTGGGTPAGSTTWIQYNNAGAFGAEAAFAYDAATNTLTVDNITTAGRVLTSASTTSRAGLCLPHGTAPTSPVDGDTWTTTLGIYVRVNGVTVGPLSAGGGGGLTNFTEGVSTAAPNATVPVAYLNATNAATNVDVAICPKGAGAFSVSIADNTATGGNKRGAGAFDGQRTRTANTHVASGADSALVGGAGNTSSGSGAGVVGGTANIASGTYSGVIGGRACLASGAQSLAHGYGGDARGVDNSRAFACNASGSPKGLELLLGALTSNATPAVLTSNGSATAALANQFIIPAGVSMLRVIIAAHHASNTDSAGWDIPVLVKNIGGTVSIVGTPVVTQAFGDAGASAWAVAISANSTLDCLTITVTGVAATNIYWSAYVIGPHAA